MSGTDSLRGTTSASFSVAVRPAVGVAIDVLPASPELASPVAFAAVVTGGVGPCLSCWSFGSGHPTAEPAPGEVLNRTGTYTVTAYGNGPAGGSAHDALQVTVSALPSTGSGVGSAPARFWDGVGGLAVAALAGSVLLPRRRPAAP